MKLSNSLLFPMICSIVLSVVGCQPNTTSQSSLEPARGSSTAIENSPERVAIDFFTAILINNDIDRAKNLSDASMKRVLEGYGSGKSVGRTLFNMRFDQLVITVDDTDRSVREFHRDKTDIILVFTGTFDDERIVSIRQVRMSQHKNQWFVFEVRSDPFARTDV